MEPNTFIIQEKYFRNILELKSCFKFLRAGPRKEIAFESNDTRVAIVSTDGLCPGINVVIKGLVESLEYEYAVKEIWGIKWGYMGFYEKDEYWLKLDHNAVKDIQNLGGTILGSSRGGVDIPKMVEALEKRKIN